METPTPLVLVVRAWTEEKGVRGRLLFEEGGEPSSLVCGSVDELCEAVCAAIRRWATGSG
jgi:hypothetical protein